MKRSRTSVPALIRALGFIAARQLEAGLPKQKPKPAPPAKERSENVEALPPPKIARRYR